MADTRPVKDQDVTARGRSKNGEGKRLPTKKVRAKRVEGKRGGSKELTGTKKGASKAGKERDAQGDAIGGATDADAGSEMLSRAVGQAVARNSNKIAKALVKRTIEGHGPSARLLISLVERDSVEEEEVEVEAKPVRVIDLRMDPEEEKEWKEDRDRWLEIGKDEWGNPRF